MSTENDFLNKKALGHQLYVALVHWPVLNKAGEIVATNVTNFDIHDIARACRTYGVSKYFIVNRVEEQLIVVARMLDHWKVGEGSQLNPMRKTALNMIELEPTIEKVLQNHFKEQKPFVIATAARDLSEPPKATFREIRDRLQSHPEVPILLVFGTGFGLSEQVLLQSNALLEPIQGASLDDYRHLSVRSAVSICLDRLLGAW